MYNVHFGRNEIKFVKNQDLYRNKDDLWIFSIQNVLIFFILKILYLIIIFVKCNFWQISNKTVENQDSYIDKGDFGIFFRQNILNFSFKRFYIL